MFKLTYYSPYNSIFIVLKELREKNWKTIEALNNAQLKLSNKQATTSDSNNNSINTKNNKNVYKYIDFIIIIKKLSFFLNALIAFHFWYQHVLLNHKINKIIRKECIKASLFFRFYLYIPLAIRYIYV